MKIKGAATLLDHMHADLAEIRGFARDAFAYAKSNPELARDALNDLESRARRLHERFDEDLEPMLERAESRAEQAQLPERLSELEQRITRLERRAIQLEPEKEDD